MKGKRWELPQKFRTIYWQNFALTASIVMLTLALLGASFFALSYAYAADERSDEMAQKASVVARLVASYASSGDVRDMREMAGVAASMTDVDFLVCSTEGSVLLTTDENLVDHVLTVPSDVMETALSGERYSARTTLGGIYESKRFVVGVPIESDIWTVGAVFAVTETGRLTTMWRAFFAMFLMTSVIVLLLSFVASAWVSMRQSRPIHEMAEATRRFAEGNFDVRMHNYEGVTEISELAESFNNMADSLQETERQRREFIANVSHELKTPMTTIAGYTDGILDGTIPPEETKHYLGIVSQETGRLARLVQNMLDITKLEAGEVPIHAQTYDLWKTVTDVVLSDEQRIEDGKIDIQGLGGDPLLIYADPDFVHQVVYNIVDNAIKFTPAGGTISFAAERRGNMVEVRIENTGAGIAPEALPFVFERFYKEDRSRGMNTRGSGLGLHICKILVNLSGGQIHAESEEGNWCRFVFTLPAGQ